MIRLGNDGPCRSLPTPLLSFDGAAVSRPAFQASERGLPLNGGFAKAPRYSDSANITASSPLEELVEDRTRKKSFPTGTVWTRGLSGSGPPDDPSNDPPDTVPLGGYSGRLNSRAPGGGWSGGFTASQPKCGGSGCQNSSFQRFLICPGNSTSDGFGCGIPTERSDLGTACRTARPRSPVVCTSAWRR